MFRIFSNRAINTLQNFRANNRIRILLSQTTITDCIANQIISEIVYPSDDEKGRGRYEGNLKNGIPSGYGKMFWKNGEKYEGNTNLHSQALHTWVKISTNTVGTT